MPSKCKFIVLILIYDISGAHLGPLIAMKVILMLNILLIADIVSKIISLVIFVCLAMWSIRNLKVHDVSYATAILRQVIKTIVSKGLLYFTGGPAERSIIRSIIGTIIYYFR